MASRQQEGSSGAQDPASFDAFCLAERSRLWALLAAVAGWDGADDLTQEVLARAYAHWDRLASYERPDLWLRRVGLNLAATRRRRRWVEHLALERLARQRQPALRGAEPDPELWRAVRRLPRRQAEIVGLHYLDDRSHAEIAEVLGLSAATVRVHLHRARLALARQLGEPSPGDDEMERA